MKIEYRGKEILLYIYHLDKQVDFTDKKEIEFYFKSLFVRLKDSYGLELTGFYNITVYHDPVYGVILVLEKEEFEYYPDFEESLDMRITVAPFVSFLYEIEDIFQKKKDSIVYTYEGKYYLEMVGTLTETEKGQLLEYARPIFEEEIKNIKRYGKKIDI